TAYGISSGHDTFDADSGFGFLDGLTQDFFGVPNGTTGVAILDDTHTRKFTQELRSTTHLGAKVDWLLGGFYTHERNPYVQSLGAIDHSTGLNVGNWGTFSWIVNYAEYAAFTDLTVHFTDRFDLQFGGRESHNTQTYREVDSGALFDQVIPQV